ncbi:hypothetical protein ARMSODRAFT_977015 [Armillaria solidipes]|uniref:Uncharacterized protein n=1 Tax=Armillaria solidipes TaxID=1076256 RepID=A0A2H3B8Z5_9AGAR|nr:hypothetical protein ARMSODRAFT_977015 [Armillaria solidipes]
MCSWDIVEGNGEGMSGVAECWLTGSNQKELAYVLPDLVPVYSVDEEGGNEGGDTYDRSCKGDGCSGGDVAGKTLSLSDISVTVEWSVGKHCKRAYIWIVIQITTVWSVGWGFRFFLVVIFSVRGIRSPPVCGLWGRCLWYWIIAVPVEDAGPLVI